MFLPRAVLQARVLRTVLFGGKLKNEVDETLAIPDNLGANLEVTGPRCERERTKRGQRERTKGSSLLSYSDGPMLNLSVREMKRAPRLSVLKGWSNRPKDLRNTVPSSRREVRNSFTQESTRIIPV
jgi:hypothetical protein